MLSIWFLLAIMYNISFSIKYWHITCHCYTVYPPKRQRPIHPVRFQIVVEAASNPIQLIYLFQTDICNKKILVPHLFLHPFIQHALESSLISRAPYQFVGRVSEFYNVEADRHSEQGAFKENHSPCAAKVSS